MMRGEILMKLKYEDMVTFMQQYCRDYSQWCNDLEAIPKLEQYYTSDFSTKAYMHLQGRPYPFVANLDQFKNFIARNHIDILHEEKLFPIEILIDERKNKAIMVLKVKKTVKSSSEVFDFDAIALYQLALDENNSLKIKSLEIITDRPSTLTQWVKS